MAAREIERDLPGTDAADHRRHEHAARTQSIGNETRRGGRIIDAVERAEVRVAASNCTGAS